MSSLSLGKQLDLMESLIKVAHKGQKYGDKPYTYHLSMVRDTFDKLGLYVNDEEYMEGIVACLGHDLIEDTYITKQDLFEKGFSFNIVNAIDLVSKKDNLSYRDYLKLLSMDKLAWKVKVADTYSNLTESIKVGNIKRVRKYSNQLELLYKHKSF